MTLRHFRIFLAVCETMNMTLAAQSLLMTQSAVSQSVNELEKYYDVRLFERLARKLYLTEAGEKLLNYAQHMLRMNSDLEEDMKAIQHTGLIRLGASITVGASILPALISRFRETYPSTEIEVFVDNTDKVEKRLLSDKTDIGLVEGDTTSQYIVNTPFMNDELVLVCGAAHRFASWTVVPPHELQKENFIIREIGSGTRKTFENIMSAHQLTWKSTWTCNNADTIKAAVAAGIGVSVISRMAVAKEAKAGELHVKTIDGIRFDRQYKIVYHINKYLTKVMEDFIGSVPGTVSELQQETNVLNTRVCG